MKTLFFSVALLISASVGYSQEVYNLRSFMKVFVCPEGTPADDCEPATNSNVPIEWTLSLVDQGTSDPMTFIATQNANVVRDGINYALEVSVIKFMYGNEPSKIFYEVHLNVTPEGRSKKKVVLNYHNMGEFNTRVDQHLDIYNRGATQYSPIFMTMPANLSAKLQLRKPILADIMASE